MTVERRRRALDPRPRAHTATPPDDRVQHARVVLDLGVLEHNGVLDACSGADDRPGADGDVGPQLGRRVDRRGGVDEDWGNDVGGGRGELVRSGLEGLLEVQRVGRHGGSGRLDLPPEVLGLVHEEAVAVGQVGEDVLLQAEDLAALRLLVVCSGSRGGSRRRDEGFEVLGRGVRDEAGAGGAALDGAADGGEDALGREQVDAAVDQVGDVRLGLLDVVQDALGVRVGHDAAEVGCGLIADPRAQDDRLGVLLLEQLQHIEQRERAADVGVEDEEPLGPALEDGVAEVIQSTGGAQRRVLAQVQDAELGELLGGVLDEVAEDGLIVVADQDDLAEAGDIGKGLEAVVDDGVTGDFEQGLYATGYFPSASCPNRNGVLNQTHGRRYRPWGRQATRA
mgnify:CR=1 FL=1